MQKANKLNSHPTNRIKWRFIEEVTVLKQLSVVFVMLFSFTITAMDKETMTKKGKEAVDLMVKTHMQLRDHKNDRILPTRYKCKKCSTIFNEDDFTKHRQRPCQEAAQQYTKLRKEKQKKVFQPYSHSNLRSISATKFAKAEDVGSKKAGSARTVYCPIRPYSPEFTYWLMQEFDKLKAEQVKTHNMQSQSEEEKRVTEEIIQSFFA